MSSYIEVDGERTNGRPEIVMSLIYDIRNAINKCRTTGESCIYPITGENDKNERIICGYILGPNSHVTFQIDEPDVNEPDELKQVFQEMWEKADFKHVTDRFDQAAEEASKDSDKADSSQPQKDQD